MTSWQQLEEEAPELAAKIRSRFEAHETHILATLRKDGSPRVSGSEVDFSGGGLSFGSMLGAVKARDLQRDGRFAIHAHPADPGTEGDAKIAGIATEATGQAEKDALRTEQQPPGDYHAFVVSLTEAVLTSVDEAAQELIVEVWRPGQGVTVVRRK